MPFALLLLGGAVVAYSLWQLRRWFQEAERQAAAGPRRLEAIAEELIATAEGTSAAVAEKTEALEGSIARANAALARLEAVMAGDLSPRPAPAGMPKIARRLPVQRHRAPVPEAAAAVAAAVQEPVPAPAPAAELPEVYRRVYGLADAGLDITGIARQLSLTKGEVQLILGIRRTN